VEPIRAALVHLGPDVSSLGEGRRFVARTLRDWDVDEDTIEPVMLVEALSDCWGVDASESGKSVWVTFAGTFG